MGLGTMCLQRLCRSKQASAIRAGRFDLIVFYVWHRADKRSTCIRFSGNRQDPMIPVLYPPFTHSTRVELHKFQWKRGDPSAVCRPLLF